MTKRTKNNPYLSLVVPALNEESRIEDSLRSIRAYLGAEKLVDSTEVIVVTADCDDKTQQIVKSVLPNLFLRQMHINPGPKAGKGRDVRAGVLAASGQFVLYMDADLATPLSHVKEFLAELEAGGDVVMGVRVLWSMHSSLTKKISSVCANLLVRVLILPGLRDTQCGFKGFSAKSANMVFNQQTINGWGFDFEILKIAKICGLTIKQVPITDWSDPKSPVEGLSGGSQMRALATTLVELVVTWLNVLQGKYNPKN